MRHWEGDLVKGKRVSSEPAVMPFTERVRHYKIIIKIANYQADICQSALQEVFDDYSSEYFKTIKFDSGSEFASLSKVTKTTIYYLPSSDLNSSLSHLANKPFSFKTNIFITTVTTIIIVVKTSNSITCIYLSFENK